VRSHAVKEYDACQEREQNRHREELNGYVQRSYD